MRGDWFLTVAGGSHSERLASLAVDLLSSRRANYDRLRSGLGLPTRRIVAKEELRTRILTSHRREVDGDSNQPERLRHVLYSELLRLGGSLQKGDGLANPQNVEWDFHWLWRSRLKYFHRHARIWQDWVCQMILWWQFMRYVNRDKWINGFERYDRTTAGEAGGPESAQSLFMERCQTLADQLKEATPPDPHVIDTLPA